MPIFIGTSADDSLLGTVGSDTIVGLAGNDLLNDGGGGPDELIGGTGDDTYIVSSAGDSIVELAGEGFDRVNTALSVYRLPANVEWLYFTSAANASGLGNELNNAIYGGLGADELQGFGGDDQLSGTNDSGVGPFGAANTLIGGTGNDRYSVYVVGDSVIELPGEGDADSVVSYLNSFTLPPNVEYLNFSFSLTGPLLGIGNDGFNQISGGTSRDVLAGRDGNDSLFGGAGAANELIGGLGDDSYFVEAVGDSVVEYAGEGSDTVYTALAIFLLPSNVERLVYYNGTGNITGIGNALDNVLVGGPGGDTLIGLAGNDQLISSLAGGDTAPNTLIGGLGDDSYSVTVSGDSIIELAGEGRDVVTTTLASFTLPANVEELIFTGGPGPILARTGIGNALDNRIDGGFVDDVLLGLDGNDTLNGSFGNDRIYGGNGSDSLDGGQGADLFFLNGGETGIDTLVNFETGIDRIYLNRASFGATPAFDFISGNTGVPAPTSTNSSLLYDVSTRTLWFDVDGTGPTAVYQLLQFSTGVLPSAAEFVFY
jgi:Ca2+-binding RTX toxin-like protein